MILSAILFFDRWAEPGWCSDVSSNYKFFPSVSAPQNCFNSSRKPDSVTWRNDFSRIRTCNPQLRWPRRHPSGHGDRCRRGAVCAPRRREDTCRKVVACRGASPQSEAAWYLLQAVQQHLYATWSMAFHARPSRVDNIQRGLARI